jgi:hypothetical protein
MVALHFAVAWHKLVLKVETLDRMILPNQRSSSERL